MSNANWFFARAGQQQAGPITFESLKQMATSGQLRREDMVWAEGTPAWVTAGTHAELFQGVAGAVSPVLRGGVPGEIGYYEPGGGMPPRAAAALRGHTRPRGDVGDWPLDDIRVAQFKETVALRKKVTAAAGLYRLLLLLTIIAGVFVLISLLAAVGSGPRGTQSMVALGMGMSFGIVIGLGVLYYFAWRGTMRSQRSAPLTMFILFMISIAVNVLSVMFESSQGNRADVIVSYVALFFIVGLGGVFAFLSWRSFAAIPKYLAQPAWCQEIIVSAGM